MTNALKEERDGYKTSAEQLTDVQKDLDAVTKERDALQQKLDADEPYKEKYENERKSFDEFKKGVEADKEKARKADAYKALLKKAGVSEKRIDAVMKVPFDVELAEDGSVKDADAVMKNIKTEWADFIQTVSTKGAETEKPPANTGGTKTKEEIMAIKDRNERQKAISENHELFGY